MLTNCSIRLFLILLISSNCFLNKVAARNVVDSIVLSSPNKENKIILNIDKKGNAYYSVYRNSELILDKSNLGLEITDRHLAMFQSMQILSKSIQMENYVMYNAKRSHIENKFQFYTINFKNKTEVLPIEFKISNDGFAFRYLIHKKGKNPIVIQKENTSYSFLPTTKAFLQPVAVAKSGWEATNPSYEENYLQDIAVGNPEPNKTGWVYPALFHKDSIWIAISEAGLDGSYCATRLSSDGNGSNYKIAFPDKRETISKANGLLPYSDTTFYSPWRVVAIGNIKTIMESTLVTDVATPSKLKEALCQPGQSSWSWINSKDDFIVYDEQKKYIDFASDMHWKYCLIDVNWDQKIGYQKMSELSNYAKSKNVGLLLWYNSAGNWNTVKYTPKDKLLTKESRRNEFSKLEKMGIKGIKVDFFGGDGRSVIQYYTDILKDAADYHLMVNFHGATLPRGWARTYPNLMTTEAVKGFEMITFEQKAADEEANHIAMLPFTRNLFDPMDFTPMNLYKIPTNVQRKTTSSFELATSVLLLSGIQHFAESPEGMSHVSDDVKSFLRNLPTYWDDVQFIDGYPGKFAVVARRSGKKWYVAGINGTTIAKEIKLDLSFIKDYNNGSLYADGYADNSINKTKFENKPTSITMKANGGFVIVLE